MGLYIGLGVLVVLLFAVGASYNRFVRQRQLVAESWRDIDVELGRRHDLIPNLVQTVKGYAAHERTVLEQVTQARVAAQRAMSVPGVASTAQAESALQRSLGGFLAVAENYPQLKADANFLELQRQLAETEDRIAAARRFYNGNVRAYNTRIESFPSALIASAGGFRPAEFFELDDPAARAPVTVDFAPPAAE